MNKTSHHIKIDTSWDSVLSEYIKKNEFKRLIRFVNDSYLKKNIYPKKELIFRAFDLCPYEQTKVIILGQDPYHTAAAADGLAFSVGHGKSQPSLRNILKELQSDLGRKSHAKQFSLQHWAQQGVLLLNSVLTVEQSIPFSHANKGWEQFTDHVIDTLSKEKENLVFVLWGSQAQKKEFLINEKKHLIIKSAHPSPLSAYRGFFGSRPFSRINSFLAAKSISAIDW